MAFSLGRKDCKRLSQRIGGITFTLSASGDAPALGRMSQQRISLELSRLRFALRAARGTGEATIGLRFEETAGTKLLFTVDPAVTEETTMNDETLELWSRLPWARGMSAPDLGKASAPPEDTNKRILSAVRIELGVEIGVVELSLEQLLDLRPGARIDVELPPEPRIRLMLGEEPFATGRLMINDSGAFALVESCENQETEQQTPSPFEHVSEENI